MFEKERAMLSNAVKEHGWAVAHIPSDPPAVRINYSFSAGITRAGGFDVILTGESMETANDLIERLFQSAKDGHPIREGECFRYHDRLVRALKVSSGLMVKAVIALHLDETPRLIHLQFQDGSGKFPGEHGCNPDFAWRNDLANIFGGTRK